MHSDQNSTLQHAAGEVTLTLAPCKLLIASTMLPTSESGTGSILDFTGSPLLSVHVCTVRQRWSIPFIVHSSEVLHDAPCKITLQIQFTQTSQQRQRDKNLIQQSGQIDIRLCMLENRYVPLEPSPHLSTL